MRDGESFILTASIPQSLEKPVSDRLEHFVLIQWKEKRQSHPDGKLFEASIEIRIVSLTGGCSTETWGATYRCDSHEGGSVRLSNGFIGLPNEIQGRRVGTWVMNEVVSWAKQWPDARVEPIRLSQQQATQANKRRRNKFYNQFGFQFEPEAEEGSSPTTLVTAQLKTVKNPKNIEAMLTERKISALFEERSSLVTRLKSCETGRKNDLLYLKKIRKRLRMYCAAFCGIIVAGAAMTSCGMNHAQPWRSLWNSNEPQQSSQSGS